MAHLSITDLQAMKAAGQKFAVVTAYDATFARVASEAGIEAILVGDSLGMVLQGHPTTLPVTLADMCYHVAAVARGNSRSLLIADLPFASYGTPAQALDSAAALMRAGAQMVKLEGGSWLRGTVELLGVNGIPVCGHLGLTPQSVNLLGGFKVQGRQPDQARQIVDDARALVDAGIALLVLEGVPQSLGQAVTAAVAVPVIGIGAGPATDAQVLVMQDLLGLTPRAPRFSRNFMEGAASIADAFARYRAAVAAGEFPGPEHSFN